MPSHLYLPNELHGFRETYLDAMREVLPPSYRDAPDEVVAHRLRETFESLSPAQQQAFSVMSLQNTGEFSLGDIGRGLSSALGGITQALPGVLRTVAPVAQIAAPLVGTLIGGPAGAMVGRTVGNLIGNAAGQPRPQRQNPQAPARIPQVAQAPQAPQMPATPAQANIVPQGNAAVAQLMALLSNPQLIQSLLANLMGTQGPQAGATVQQPSGQTTQIPFGALMSTLSECAMRAAEESVANGGYETEDYLQNHQGRYLIADSSDPGEHADYVLGLLNDNYSYPANAAQESYHDPLTEWFVAAGMIK
jgi:hypothetical protein